MRPDVLIVDHGMDYYYASGLLRKFNQAGIDVSMTDDHGSAMKLIRNRRPRLVISEYAGPDGNIYDEKGMNYFNSLMLNASISCSFFGIVTNWENHSLEGMLDGIRNGIEFVRFIARKGGPNNASAILNTVRNIVRDPSDFMRRYCSMTYIPDTKRPVILPPLDKYSDQSDRHYNQIMRYLWKRR